MILDSEIWKTIDGRKIPIPDLTDDHLQNIHKKYLKRDLQPPPKIRNELKRRGFKIVEKFTSSEIMKIVEDVEEIKKRLSITEQENKKLKEEILDLKKWKEI